MFSAAELNEKTAIGYPTNKVVDFIPHHIHMIKMNEYDQRFYDTYPNYGQVVVENSPPGQAFTGIVNGEVVCCFGFIRLWDGVYEAWLIPTTENIRRSVVPFHRTSMRIFDYAMSKHSLKRLQITVCSENALALKWAKRCYFNNEGLLKNYGPEGADYYMLARY